MARKRKLNPLFDILVLSVFPILASIASIIFKFNFLESIFFFFCLPALYLSFRTKKAVFRALVFIVPFSLTLTLIADSLAVMDKSWYVPTIFPIRIFNTVPLEDLFFSVSLNYFIIIFYEHFLDKGNHKLIGNRVKYFSYFTIICLTTFILMFMLDKHLLQVDYFYLKSGIAILFIPTLAFVFSFPHYFKKFLKVSPYFFFIGISDELTSLHQGYWNFTGNHFIAWINLMGYKLPFEEFFFWMIILSTCTLCYFEFFDDNHLNLAQSEEAKLLKVFKKKKKRR